MAIEKIFDAVLAFEEDRIVDLVRAEVAEGAQVSAVLERGLIAAMDDVGRRFSEGEAFVPEMLLAARTMQAGLGALRPLLAEAGAKPKGTVVIGAVRGDLHDIGKNLVAMMLEGAGFRVVDLGVDVDTGIFVEAARKERADLVCISALLTTTLPSMEATVRDLRLSELPVKILVGGAPVTAAFAETIGADGYGDDAPKAVALARRLGSDT